MILANKKPTQKVSKNIFLLGIASFFNDASTEIIMPILPMLIIALGGNTLIVGLVGGLRKSIPNFVNVFVGYWSDRIGKRRIFVSSGYFISSICKFFLAFSQKWFSVLFFSSIERTGKGLRKTPIDSIIAESAPLRTGLSFGIHRALDTAGAVVGAFLAFMFLQFFHLDFKTIIIIASIIGFISLIPLIGVEKASHKPTEYSLQVTLSATPQQLQQFLIFASLFALAHFSYMFFLMRVTEFFTGKLAVILPVFLYLIFNIFYAAGAIPLGMLTDKISRRTVIILGYLLFSITSFGFVYAHTLPFFIMLFSLYGIVNAMIEGNQRAYVATLAPSATKATFLGLFHTIIGVATLASNLIAGILWSYLTPEMAFIWGSMVSLIAGLSFAFLKIK